MMATPTSMETLFDGTPSQMRDLQVQLGEFADIEHHHNKDSYLLRNFLESHNIVTQHC
jgi:hypothetical protein